MSTINCSYDGQFSQERIKEIIFSILDKGADNPTIINLKNNFVVKSNLTSYYSKLLSEQLGISESDLGKESKKSINEREVFQLKGDAREYIKFNCLDFFSDNINDLLRNLVTNKSDTEWKKQAGIIFRDFMDEKITNLEYIHPTDDQVIEILEFIKIHYY